ncbi:lipoate-protein ligase A [Thermodesulfobium acidiphilum]|uniref:Lipoate-protein ligase A n=1 Tax=Thermodesulfobium acidiphilum TaxID=1794699 RepID=A0A2R4W0Y2_THEAF|nr:biotin/lipoate A/B protein ligase family protein [Thermodesulfobium acidiphilum]AWB10469.1 lipoate-protein ligase A [Thermodesulfobium acidiphilum]
MSGRRFRFIVSSPLSGDYNMAIDEALYLTFLKKREPVIRFYFWYPSVLSVGRFQKISDINKVFLSQEEEFFIRRLTGGNALYHYEEISYSIVCSQEHLGNLSVIDSYKKLTSFVLEFYNSLHLNAKWACECESTESDKNPILCYQGKEKYDILIDGQKVGGNAQKRSHDVIFQHGSIPVKSRKNLSKPYEHGNSLQDWVHDISYETALKGLATFFSKEMKVDLDFCELTKEEIKLVSLLREKKYLSESWNRDGIEKETCVAS